MILDEKTKTKPDIEYPTEWAYKIIGRDSDQLKSCITEIMGDKEHASTKGNASKTGKFHSYNATCIVESQSERNKLFKAFENCDNIEMVI